MGSFSTDGSILFNGQPATRAMRGLVAFVEQSDDHHYAALTVRETLRYASILRLPAGVPLKRKIARAEEVLQMLGLRECANTLVGGPLLKVRGDGEIFPRMQCEAEGLGSRFRGYLEARSVD